MLFVLSCLASFTYCFRWSLTMKRFFDIVHSSLPGYTSASQMFQHSSECQPPSHLRRVKVDEYEALLQKLYQYLSDNEFTLIAISNPPPWLMF
jgi:hypothetical protein